MLYFYGKSWNGKVEDRVLELAVENLEMVWVYFFVKLVRSCV